MSDPATLAANVRECKDRYLRASMRNIYSVEPAELDRINVEYEAARAAYWRSLSALRDYFADNQGEEP